MSKSRKASREMKGQIIDSLKEALSNCHVGILTDYRGLSAQEMHALRRGLGESGIQYQVVKNTLARFAAERAGREDLVGLFDGPVAIAFGYGDMVEPAKVLVDYIGTSKASLSIRGGFLSDRLLTAEEVKTLSKLPSKEILLGRMLSGMQIPLYALASCLASPIRGLAGLLQARIQQLEGE
ncbi:50S ribosomal protein L10 [Chloroflexota bacterium]